MHDLAGWQEGNEKYLSAALSWLRLRLERLAKSAAEPTGSETESAGMDKEIEHAAIEMAAAEAMEPPPALIILSRRLGLSRFEQEVLFLCAAMELDTRIPSLCSRAQANSSMLYPTFSLAFSLFDEPGWDVLSPERSLRYWRLLEINQAGAWPLVTSPLRADERIVSYLKGLNYLDDRLAPFLHHLDAAAAGLPPSQQTVADAILNRLRTSGSQRLPMIQLLGPDRESKRLIAWHVAGALERHLYRMPAELLPSGANELETLARLWERESFLLPIALYLDAHEMESSIAGPLERFLARSNGLLFLDTRDIWPALNSSAAFEISKPTPAEQEAAWDAVLGSAAGSGPAMLAGQFNLNLPAIFQVAGNVLSEKDADGSLHHRLWDGCLAGTCPRLDVLAQRLDPRATWDSIILPSEEMELLRQIADQVRNRSLVYDRGGFRRRMNRGLGIGVLFSGVSGTGKTMAAEVIANDLRLSLYRIDLSGVVSKYIGETEKNLRRLFDAAEDGGTILFFDEADSLFGKRSEVKDSHDRYANIEINYLLQRMESFRGLAILATNMRSALDPAFVRRLRFIVDFPHPGPEERRRIWKKVFPPETKTNGLDYDRLARLNMTGGSIHNIALNAAFLAAAAGTPVTMQFVLDSARMEFRKQNRPIMEADFRL